MGTHGQILNNSFPSHAVITLVGVAHVIDVRRQIESIIISQDPDVVAVELDYGRYYAMTHRVEGDMPYIYRKMAEMQKNLARMFGTEVGSEMLVAINVARTLGKQVALIDMDSMEIVKRIKKNMGVIEKLRLYTSFLLAPFSRKRIGKEDIKEIVENEEKYVGYLRKKFPGLSRALFEDREEYMAKKLLDIEKNGHVMAFVGDAHIAGLKKLLPDAKIIRLRDIITEGETWEISYTISFN